MNNYQTQIPNVLEHQKLITNISENLGKYSKGSKQYEDQIKVLRILSKKQPKDIEVDLSI